MLLLWAAASCTQVTLKEGGILAKIVGQPGKKGRFCQLIASRVGLQALRRAYSGLDHVRAEQKVAFPFPVGIVGHVLFLHEGNCIRSRIAEVELIGFCAQANG